MQILEFLLLKYKRHQILVAFHSSQLTLWKYSPNLVDWDNSVSYATHTKDVQEVEYFLAEFKITRFSFSMNSN